MLLTKLAKDVKLGDSVLLYHGNPVKIDFIQRAFPGTTAQVLLIGVDEITKRVMGWNVNRDREMSVLIEKGKGNK